MPKPNVYLTREEVLEQGQISYQLDANLCINCGLVQLGEGLSSDELFPENYAYRTPDAMKPNFREGARETITLSRMRKGSKVLEIGSNIGTCLKEYKKLGMKVLGVDPATICSKQANEAGVRTIIEPFTTNLASEIVKEVGEMNIVTAANVMQHILDIRGTIEGIAKILAPKGVFTLEFPYLGDILTNIDFDTFYAEHYYYLSLSPLQKMFRDFGLTIVHAKHLPNIHCGSMRIFVKHFPSEMSPEAKLIIKNEEEQKFLDPRRFLSFAEKVNDIMHSIQEHLYIAKRRGDRIVAHGSSAKFVTLTNYGHIGSDLIEYVADSTEAKHGKVTPGMGIPVVPEEKLLKDTPDIIFNGIRNFYEQNKAKYDEIKKRNPKTKILIPIPEVSYR
jgi:methylation protein EvaC